jgi:DNA-binding Xre family transcriptional regulator
MEISYNRLWKLLIDKGMKKKDLRLATGMTTTALAKLGKNEHVRTETLTKICEALDCSLDDIVEITHKADKGVKA